MMRKGRKQGTFPETEDKCDIFAKLFTWRRILSCIILSISIFPDIEIICKGFKILFTSLERKSQAVKTSSFQGCKSGSRQPPVVPATGRPYTFGLTWEPTQLYTYPYADTLASPNLRQNKIFKQTNIITLWRTLL